VTRPLALAACALGLALALPVQPPGCSQTANFALARSLAQGRADIDRYHWQTCDKSYIGGHFYANKAPGLPALSAPLWAVLHRLGAEDHVPREGPPRRAEVPPLAIWPFTLLAAALPAVLLFLAMARVAARVEPRVAVAAAAAVSLGTLLLPLGTLLFSHVLAALLGFAAFALLFRPGEERTPTVALLGAGLLAGLAVTTEYPLALLAAGLGLYALRRGDVVRRAAAYGGGVVAGALPLLAYNRWAFGSPTTLSYTKRGDRPGRHRSRSPAGARPPAARAVAVAGLAALLVALAAVAADAVPRRAARLPAG
jgi:hypothetical protein